MNLALGRFLAQAEVIFEYRSTEVPGPANQRDEYRQGFLLFYDKLWDTVNLRNDLQHYQEGFVMHPVPTFSEQSVREATLNAVSHRDYRHPGSVFVRQFPRRIEIVSPGGFPAGVTPENILYRQNARNRLIADNLARCGLVERAGQGANRMFAESVRQGKRLPDFTHTDQFQVSLTLHGQIQDPDFLRFLEKVGPDRVEAFAVEDLLVLDHVHREHRVPDGLRDELRSLIGEGILERVGTGRGVRYPLSRKFYEMRGQPGEHTRRLGLDREQNKSLLLNHIRRCGADGTPLGELTQVLPALSVDQIRHLLKELRQEQQITLQGKGPASRWCPRNAPAGSPPT
jgi:ATP-dependent DNA helicase RecG